MIRTLSPRFAHAAVAAFATASIAACSDTPTPPELSARALRPALNLGGARRTPTRYPNSVKYRDTGARPATGRSGSASLMVRTLLGKDRLTSLEVTTGELDKLATPPGNIDKVQLKLLDVAGGVMSTHNYNNLRGGGYAAYSLVNLTRGSGVQVQANVGGIDANRTDVVTVRSTVSLRPDIAVTNLGAPTSALVDVPFSVAAEVRELNGDVGARANCELLVNGTPVGTATGIWVDAGDAVSCLFAVTIPTPGRAQVEVRVTGVKPGDYDAGNNVSQASVDVVEQATPFFFGITAGDYMQTAGWRILEEYTYGPDPDGVTRSLRATELTSRFEIHQIFGAMAGMLNREISFPIVGFTVTHESGGSTLLEGSWDLTALPERHVDNEGMRMDCGARFDVFDDGMGAVFTDICSGVDRIGGQEFPFTHFGHVRLLSQVTYWAAEGEVEIHDPSQTPPDQFWTYNVNIDQPSTLKPLGSTYRMRVELTSGDWTYVHDGTVELAPHRVEYPVEPWTCRPITIPYYVGQNCEERYGGGELGRLGFQTFFGTVQARVE